MRRLFHRHKAPPTSPGSGSEAAAIADSSAPTTAFPAGIKVLYDPEDCVADIVFIHGLTGDRERTWTAQGASAPWPQTLLPPKVPGARILTFGYDAYVVNWGGLVSQNRIADHALNLLTTLAAYRRDAGVGRRPIIFVCHSLGGLVCQDALVVSRQRPEPHLRDISILTRGILFLGTPHRGSDLARWAEMLAGAVGNVKQTNRRIVEVLKRDSEVLSRVQDGFHTMLLSRSQDGLPPIEVACFYEELPLPGVGTVVPRESAVLPGYVAIGIHNHHRDMTKFDSSQDHGFFTLSRELCRLVDTPDTLGGEATPEPSAADESATSSIRLPSSSHDAGKQAETPRGHWVVPFGRNKDFVGREHTLDQLLEKIPPGAAPDDCQRTAIDGLGGVGKTQVALEAAFRLRDANPKCSVFWVPAIDAATFENAYLAIATVLGIEKPDTSSADVKEMVKAALSTEAAGEWLLVIDNADDIELLFNGSTDASLSNYLPFSRKGSILFTTRTHEMTVRLDIPPSDVIDMVEMIPADAIDLLLRNLRATQVGDSQSTADLTKLLAYMPLAIKQASAYMAKTGISTTKYLELCQSGDKTVLVDLLSRDFEDRSRYKDIKNPVATTWLISFEHIARDNELASWYLRVMCTYADKNIPAALLPPRGSELELVEAMGILKAYAFVTEREEDASYDIHRLVAMAMRNWLDEAGELGTFAHTALEHLGTVWKPNPMYVTRHVWTRYIPHTQAALAIGDETVGGAARGEVLSRLARSFRTLRKDEQAIPLYEQSRSVWERLHGKDDDRALNISFKIGQIQSKTQSYEHEKTLRLLRDTLARTEALLGREHNSTSAVRATLGVTLSRTGQHDEAEEMLREALRWRIKHLGTAHRLTRASQRDLAGTLSRRGKHAEAQELVSALINGEGKNSHYELSRCFKAYGRVMTRQDRNDEAVHYYSQARDHELQSRSGSDVNIIELDTRMAKSYFRLGQLEEAMVAYQRSFQLAESVFGADHRTTRRVAEGLQVCREIQDSIERRKKDQDPG